MITIALIGDVHDERARLGRVLGWLSPEAPDLALLVGDVGLDPPWSEPVRRTGRAAHDESVRAVLAQVRERLDCPVGFVPGNHDLADPAPGIDAVNCDRRVVELAGLRIAGFGGAGPARFGFPYEWGEAEAALALERLGNEAGAVDIVVCHTPPAESRLDRIARGDHVGSHAVRRFIASTRPGLFACGHIHEAFGLETVEGVPCLNAGALGEPHAQEIGWLVRWEAGKPAGICSFRSGTGSSPVRQEWLSRRVG